jgi:NDP-sugar pyrophosphorylase family protein
MELVLIYSDTKSFEPLQSILPVSLISIMGKPLIQHQLEVAYGQGIRRCTIIASDNLWKIRNFCDDGSRFGVQLKLVTAVPSGDEVKSLLRHRNLLSDYCLILAGRTLANLPLDKLRRLHDESKKRISVIRHGATREVIGLLTSSPSPGDLLVGCEGSIRDAAEYLVANKPGEINVVDADFPHFVCRSLSEVLRLTSTVLDSPTDYIHNTNFAQQDSGIYLGHHTMIHASAKLYPPVAIGDFCQIMEGAEIGPHTTVSSGSIVAKGARVGNAIVSPGTYIGEMMEVRDAVVVGGALVQALTGIKVLVSDPLLLDNIGEHSAVTIANSLIHRTAALGLLTTLFPLGVSLAAISKLRPNRAVSKTPTLGYGDIEDPADIGWLPRFNRFEIADSNLPFSWYPTLYNILRGQMRFTGPGPMSASDTDNSASMTNTERFKVPPGLFPVEKLFESDSAEAAFAEAIYTRKKGVVQDLRCVAANLTQRIIGKRNARWLAGL